MPLDSIDSSPETASSIAATPNSRNAADDGTGFAVVLVLAATAFVVAAAALADYLNGLG